MAFTQTDLDRINQAIARGQRRVTFADRTVEYQDTAALLAAKRAIEQELAANDPAAAVKRVRKIRGTGF